FTSNISSGFGYIALAAMIFGRWTPLGSVAAALLFGFSYQLQTELSVLRVPVSSFILLMAPYVATIIAVAGLVGRVRPPGRAAGRTRQGRRTGPRRHPTRGGGGGPRRAGRAHRAPPPRRRGGARLGVGAGRGRTRHRGRRGPARRARRLPAADGGRPRPRG